MDNNMISEKAMDLIIDTAAKQVGEIILAATDHTANEKLRFIMACQIGAHVFGVAGALFQRMPGREATDRKEAADAVLQVISGYATQQH